MVDRTSIPSSGDGFANTEVTNIRSRKLARCFPSPRIFDVSQILVNSHRAVAWLGSTDRPDRTVAQTLLVADGEGVRAISSRTPKPHRHLRDVQLTATRVRWREDHKLRSAAVSGGARGARRCDQSTVEPIK
jgi:hypothetical protein